MVLNKSNNSDFGNEMFEEMDRVLKSNYSHVKDITKAASVEVKETPLSILTSSIVSCAAKLDELGHPSRIKADAVLNFIGKEIMKSASLPDEEELAALFKGFDPESEADIRQVLEDFNLEREIVESFVLPTIKECIALVENGTIDDADDLVSFVDHQIDKSEVHFGTKDPKNLVLENLMDMKGGLDPLNWPDSTKSASVRKKPSLKSKGYDDEFERNDWIDEDPRPSYLNEKMDPDQAMYEDDSQDQAERARELGKKLAEDCIKLVEKGVLDDADDLIAYIKHRSSELDEGKGFTFVDSGSAAESILISMKGGLDPLTW